MALVDSLALLKQCDEISGRLSSFKLSGEAQPVIQKRSATVIENALFNGKTVLNRRRSSLGVRAMTSTVKELSDAEKIVKQARELDDAGHIITAMEEVFVESGVGQEEQIEAMKAEHLQLLSAISSLKDRVRQNGGSKLNDIVERKKISGTRDFDILVEEKHKSVQALEQELDEAREKVSQLLDEREKWNVQTRQVIKQESSENLSTNLTHKVKSLEEKCRQEQYNNAAMDANLKELEARYNVLPEAMQQLERDLINLQQSVKNQRERREAMFTRNPNLANLKSEVEQLREQVATKRQTEQIVDESVRKWNDGAIRLLAYTAKYHHIPSAIVLFHLIQNGGEMDWDKLITGLQAQFGDELSNHINNAVYRLMGKELLDIDRSQHPSIVRLQ
eukprot:CFRG2810T1